MKLVTAKSGEKTVELNRSDWEKIGKAKGWTTKAGWRREIPNLLGVAHFFVEGDRIMMQMRVGNMTVAVDIQNSNSEFLNQIYQEVMNIGGRTIQEIRDGNDRTGDLPNEVK